MNFYCKISDTEIRCVVNLDQDVIDPVFCTSGMAPLCVVSGGIKLTQTGAYIEIQLPSLLANTDHEFILKYNDFAPANRAWMPLGGYLRTPTNQIIQLPPLNSGFKSQDKNHDLPFDGIKLIPQPLDWHETGETVAVDTFSSTNPAMLSVAALAVRQEMGAFLSDIGFPIVEKKIELPIDAYEIEIGHDCVEVAAAGYAGYFNAAITLLSLLSNYNGILPCGSMKDEPHFSWRGQHLDCARHFYNPNTIIQLLDVMSLLKLNRFHWHFADDEAFRVQIDCYPELWQKTEMRGEGHLIPAIFSSTSEAGGSYSKQDVQRIVAHAKELNIEVLPEIEVPAHSLALTRIFPETRDPQDSGEETSIQGYKKNVVNPAMPKTWEILEAITTEIGELFPFGVLHLGCDELPTNTWGGSPAAQALMKAENLETTDDLLGWTIARLAQSVVKNGQRPAAWQEAAKGKNGGIGHDAILFSWTGSEPGWDAARAGYDVVMSPAQHVYLDMAHTDDVNDWGANWAAYVALENTIEWDPLPVDEPELGKKIIGVQGAFWSEFTTDDKQIWPMLLPRILGIATKAWQKNDISTKELKSLGMLFESSTKNGAVNGTWLIG